MAIIPMMTPAAIAPPGLEPPLAPEATNKKIGHLLIWLTSLVIDIN